MRRRGAGAVTFQLAAAEWGGVKVVTLFKSVYETVYVSTSSRRALLTFCPTTGQLVDERTGYKKEEEEAARDMSRHSPTQQ